jgi:iron complex transport system substrate-binding protein
MRIVSLVPAGTEILFALGLESHVVGVSHECDLPAGAPPLPRLTRSAVPTDGLSSAEIDAAIANQVAAGAPIYAIDAGALEALRPDLILTQGLCDVCALPAHAVESALRQLSWRPAVLSLDAHGMDGVLDSIHDIGEHTGHLARARALADELRARHERVASAVAPHPRVPVVCLEWLDPPYACGHWIPEMVACAGGAELLGRSGARSVPVPWADIERAGTSVVIAMPCGYDLSRAIQDLERVVACTPWTRAVGEATVYVAAGGTYFTRPGPGLVTGVEVLASVLHPDVVTWSVAAQAIARWRATMTHQPQRAST